MRGASAGNVAIDYANSSGEMMLSATFNLTAPLPGNPNFYLNAWFPNPAAFDGDPRDYNNQPPSSVGTNVSWDTAFVYDDQGRVTLAAMPSAVGGF